MNSAVELQQRLEREATDGARRILFPAGRCAWCRKKADHLYPLGGATGITWLCEKCHTSKLGKYRKRS